MGLARNLSKFKPNSDGLVEASDLGFALSSEAVSKSFPLKSGSSLSAGRAVNINSSGEVGDYPVSNSLGSLVTNTGGYPYNLFSSNGTRALYWVSTEPQAGRRDLTIRGMVVTDTGFTNGTVTVSSSVNYRAGYSGGVSHDEVSAVPINETQFLVFWATAGQGMINDETPNVPTSNFKGFVVTVDSSGNCTKGNEYTLTGSTGNAYYNWNSVLWRPNRFLNNTFFAYYNLTHGGGGNGPRGYYVTISDTVITYTQDNDFYNFAGTTQSGGEFGQLTSGNIAVGTNNGNTLYAASWNGSALGTPSSFTLDTSSPTGVCSRVVSSSIVVTASYNSTNTITLKTYSINQSTGAVTVVSSRILDNTLPIATPQGFNIVAENSTKIVVLFKVANTLYAYPVEIDSSGNILGNGLRTPIGNLNVSHISYIGSSSTYRVSNNNNLTQNLIINSYNTPSWNTLGVSVTSQNTSPASVIVSGIAGGFTGLTPSTKYYIDESTYNGSITSTPSNVLLGTAISSTEILI